MVLSRIFPRVPKLSKNFTRSRALATQNPSGFLCNRTGSFHRAIHDGLEKTQVLGDAGDKTTLLKNPKVSEDADKICKILSTSGSNSPIKSLLDGASVDVSPTLVEAVLKKFSSAGVLALSFFRWAEKQKGFKHNTESYNALIEAPGKIKRFKMVWELVNDMKIKGLLRKETFELISRRYARAKKVKEAIEAFEKMEKFGMKVEGSDFNRPIDTLSKSRQVERAQEVFDKMKKRRFEPDIKSYTILLEGWGQEQNFLRLNEVYGEMRDEGFDPDDVTYAILIRAHCKAKK